MIRNRVVFMAPSVRTRDVWERLTEVPLLPARLLDATAFEYDDRMKRITVSLPDELLESIKRAAGGEGRVSSYVAAALEDYQERETLDEILAAWRAETPLPDDVRQQVSAELDEAGLAAPDSGGKVAG